MNYPKGKEYTVADALSCFPLVGPRRLRTEGKGAALDILPASMQGMQLNVDRVWFNAEKDTAYLNPIIRDWKV